MKKGTSKIKAIIFDVGGVLALGYYAGRNALRGHHKLGVHRYVAKKLKISLDQWFDAIDSVYADSIEGIISERKVLSIISRNVKTSRKKLERIIIQAYKKNFKENKELYKLALKLKKSCYKIAILSDQWHVSKKYFILKKYYKNFDVIIVSCAVGLRKPDPKIYRLTLKKLNIPAKNCLFIDNQEWNIRPARKLGMKTILFKNNKQTIEKLKKMLEK